MPSGCRCGTMHVPERDCKNCGTRMDYIFNTEQRELEPFRASREHAWLCPGCQHIEREPIR